MSTTIRKTSAPAEPDIHTQDQSHIKSETPTPEFLEKPPTVIEPSKSWTSLRLADFWRYRELLYFLAWRDVKIRYKQTAIGVLWVIGQPLLSTLVFTVFLGRLVKVPSDGVPYPLLVLSGLLPWTFFSTAVVNSSNSLVGSAYLITKVYFPRILIPAAAVAARLLDFAISFLILLAMMLYYGVGFSRQILMVPVLMLLISLLALAVGMWTSAMNVRYRDVGVALPVLIQFWMFASPIVYSSSIVYSSGASRALKIAYTLNPLVGVADNFRAALLGRAFNWPALGVASLFTIALLLYAARVFQRMERSFADII